MLGYAFRSSERSVSITVLTVGSTRIRPSNILTEVRSTSQTVREAVLSKLPVAEDAAFDSHAEEHNARCHPSTRTELLCQIQDWANNPQAESIFWLNGKAGTGKSTISRTVAKSFADDGLLGGSFFFKRGEGDRGKAARVFPTIASQLVCKIPSLASSVRKAIDDDPAVPRKALIDQFERLILQPLSCIHHATAIVIIIDALDECDGDAYVKTIISLLARANTLSSVRLRVFITSRPELPIRLGFKNKDVQGKYQDLVLDRIPESIVERDISALARETYHSKSRQMAVPFFIFAATICRFIEDAAWSDPADQLEKVLQYQTQTHDSELDKLDATYLPILNQLTIGRANPQRSRLSAEFRDVVGPIVLLAQPLSVSSLAGLLNFSPNAIYGKLNSLHSVLSIPSRIDSPVRLFHLSFYDFLVDPTKRAKEFWIDKIQYHKMLADRCIRLSHQHLRRDICGLQVPGKLRSEVDQQTIDDTLPPEAQYACQYWVHHVKKSKSSVRDGGPVHSFLTRHLLHWLEALSLLGRISESISMVDNLLALNPADTIEISGFLRDIRRVLLRNRSIIDIAPLQTLEGHDGYVLSVAFSPDSKLIISGSEDKTVKIWDTATGICVQTLKGHDDEVILVAFSLDSKLVASGSLDKTVKIWDVATGIVKIWDVAAGTHSDAATSSNFITSSSGDPKNLHHQDYGIQSQPNIDSTAHNGAPHGVFGSFGDQDLHAVTADSAPGTAEPTVYIRFGLSTSFSAVSGLLGMEMASRWPAHTWGQARVTSHGGHVPNWCNGRVWLKRCDWAAGATLWLDETLDKNLWFNNAGYYTTPWPMTSALTSKGLFRSSISTSLPLSILQT
ncbi:hypothetical protein B0H63DRAFT_538288 [Podospora didyma]|uniref:NACHT domain-containing protein n=1 Tax=Podospora didyma TaxID=330526 RepID=A0AAE0U446_9PEZI|nr:hypothetical protein B0H63DRAFT_538288 [Podospora didyma]